MSDTDSRKIAVGLVLLAVSTILLFGTGTVAPTAPVVLVTVATFGLAAGSLLLGTAGSGRPV